MDFISANLEREVPLDEVAANSAMSKYHFHRVFRLVTGETVADFVRRNRLQVAARELVTGGRSVTEVAHHYGFSSAQNFARTLKRELGKTPSQLQSQSLEEIGYARPPQRRHNPEDILMNEPELLELPPQRVVYTRIYGVYQPVSQLLGSCLKAYQTLHRYARLAQLPKRPIIAAIWDYPGLTPELQCRGDLCLPLPEEFADTPPALAVGTLPGGLYLRAECRIRSYDYDSCYLALVDWMDQHNFQLAEGPGYEAYNISLVKLLSTNYPLTISLPVEARG